MADVNSNYNSVIANIKIHLRALKRPKQKPRFLLDTLKNPEINLDFSKTVFANLPMNQTEKIPIINGQI